MADRECGDGGAVRPRGWRRWPGWLRLAAFLPLCFVMLPALLAILFLLDIPIAPFDLRDFDMFRHWPALGLRLDLLGRTQLDAATQAGAALYYVALVFCAAGLLIAILVACCLPDNQMTPRLSFVGFVVATLLFALGALMAITAAPFSAAVHRETGRFNSLDADIIDWYFGAFTMAGCLALLVATLTDFLPGFRVWPHDRRQRENARAAGLSGRAAAANMFAESQRQSGMFTMTDARRPLGILCALPEEMQLLAASIADATPDERAGTIFLSGILDGCAVTIAEGGIGKVGAALAATLLLERFDCRTLIFTGVAGGLDPALGIGDIVIAERLIQHDYGAVVGDAHMAFRGGDFPLGEARRDPAFALDPQLLERLKASFAGYAPPRLAASVLGEERGRQPRLVFGTVVTGDTFVNSAAMRELLHERWSAQAVEMEGAAVAQVAERFGVPAIVIRALSDLAGAESHMDFGQFLDVASEAAADVVRKVVGVMRRQ